VALCKLDEKRPASLGIRLLSDLRIVFGDAAALHSEVIVQRLVHGDAHGLDDDAPWASPYIALT